MSKREVLVGATDQTIDIFVQDSSSTVGAGLTGLVFNTAGLTCYYRKGATGTPTALTLATQTVGGAHSDGGFVAVDGTNCPGQYRLDLSDTIVAAAGMVTLYLRGATNMVPCRVEIEVVSVDKFNATTMGISSLTEPIDANVTQWLGTAAATPTVAGVPEVDVTHWIGTAAATPTVAGVPEVDVTHFGGTAGTFSSGRAEVNTSHVSGTIQTAGDIIGDTNDIQTRLPAALVGGRIDASVGAMAANVITAAATAADYITEVQSGLSTLTQAQVQTECEEALQSHHVVLVKTTIATLASQVSFTLTAGSADNDAYNGCEIVIEDSATAAQKAIGVVSDYTGATKTIALLNDPAVFTMAAGDIVTIRPSRALKATVDNRTLDVTATGAAGIDWGNVENPTTAVNLSATNIDVDQVVASVSGAVGSISGVTFPSNFAALGINASGHVSRVVLVDTLTTYTGNTLQTGDSFARLGAPAGASVSADIAAKATPAQVNAEVLDVLNVDTFAEPGQEAPPATTTLVKKIGYLFKSLINKKTQSATERKLYNSAGTVVDQKATDSDSGTEYTKGSLGTGP